jgi:hypothetical protein
MCAGRSIRSTCRTVSVPRLTAGPVVATLCVRKHETAMMPSFYWAVFAGVALLGAAAVLNMMFGRDLTRTRANLLVVKRLSAGIRRVNDELKTKTSTTEPGRSSPPSGRSPSGTVAPPPVASGRRQAPLAGGDQLAPPIALPEPLPPPPSERSGEPGSVWTIPSPVPAPEQFEAPSVPPVPEPLLPPIPRGTGRRRTVRSNE